MGRMDHTILRGHYRSINSTEGLFLPLYKTIFNKYIKL